MNHFVYVRGRGAEDAPRIPSKGYSGGDGLPIPLDTMTVWAWIGVGVAGLLAVSLVVGLAIAQVLGTISGEIGQLLEAEAWTLAPLTRETEPLALAPHNGSETDARDRGSRSFQN
jgi:hypothetical protein